MSHHIKSRKDAIKAASGKDGKKALATALIYVGDMLGSISTTGVHKDPAASGIMTGIRAEDKRGGYEEGFRAAEGHHKVKNPVAEEAEVLLDPTYTD